MLKSEEIFSRFCLMKVLLSLIQQWDPFLKGKAVWSQRNCTSTHWYQKAILSNLAIPQGSGSGTMKLETHVRLISSLCTLFTPHKAFPYFTMVVMTRPMKQMMGSVHCSSHRIMKQLVSVLLWYTSFFENLLGLPFSPRPDRNHGWRWSKNEADDIIVWRIMREWLTRLALYL